MTPRNTEDNLGWLVLPWSVLMIVMGFSVGSLLGVALSMAAIMLTAPPLWSHIKQRSLRTYTFARWSGAVAASFFAMIANGAAYSETPEGKSVEVRRLAEKKDAENKIRSDQHAKAKTERAARESEIASGEHCLSSWDGSFPRLREAIKSHLRNPRSFEHIETNRSPVDAQGKFGLIMTYRAENGFSGMNVEAVGVEVDAKTCHFKQADAGDLAKRLANRS